MSGKQIIIHNFEREELLFILGPAINHNYTLIRFINSIDKKSFEKVQRSMGLILRQQFFTKLIRKFSLF